MIDVNRQSLDRVVPDIAVGRIGKMFDAAGWQAITVKYGRRLRELFGPPGGDALRDRIDSMSNEEYQRLLRTPAADMRGAPRRRRQGSAEHRAGARRPRRRCGRRRRGRSRRPRPRRSHRRLRAGLPLDRSADGRVRLHDQGVGPPDPGPPRQPFGPAHRPAVGAARPRPRRRSSRPLGALRRAAARKRRSAGPPPTGSPGRRSRCPLPRRFPPTSAGATRQPLRPNRPSAASSSTSPATRPTSPPGS